MKAHSSTPCYATAKLAVACITTIVMVTTFIGSAGTSVAIGTNNALAPIEQTQPLPTFKVPSPSKFDLTGTISVGPQATNLAATGAISGDQFQQDMTITPPAGPPLAFSSVQSGSMFYFKLTGVTTADQWQVIDLSTTPGNVPNIQSNIPGLNGFNPNGGQRTYEAVTSSQSGGSETVNGTATTMYQGTVDVARLYTSIGVPAAQAAQVAAVSNMTVFLWVSDLDQTLQKQRVLLNSKAPAPNGALLDVVVDFTITYREIGTPVTVTVPTNAVPYNPAGAGTGAQPAPAPPVASTQPGMPRTGAASPVNDAVTILFAAILLGSGILVAGFLLRRKGGNTSKT